MPAKRFAIAVSFPGEHKRFVRNVVGRLAEELGRDRVFYYDWYQAELLGKDGDLKLREIYRDQSEIVVPFFSEHYAKPWCEIEWSATRAMLLERHKEDAVLPVQMDLTSIPGWEEIDIAIRRQEGGKQLTGKQVAEKLLAVYRLRDEEEDEEGDSRDFDDNGTADVEGVPIDVSRINKYAPVKLIGRTPETHLIESSWQQTVSHAEGRPHVLTIVALGGEGKTSLVSKWAAGMAARDWPGCEAAFAWSFYSQGTRDQIAVSSDLFLAEALKFFGDPEMAGSAHGAYDKGRRLAQLIGERRSLLILDGLEPLQYSPTAPTPGLLKDQGVEALLKGLAANSKGLCIVTTRYSLPDLKAFAETTAREKSLPRLPRESGVQLLKSFGVNGSEHRDEPTRDNPDPLNEYEQLVEDVKGHALTLNLLGTYLRDAHGGDIRQRDLIDLAEANSAEQGGHAFRVLDAYVHSIETGATTDDENQKARRALSLLQLLGLFDRPAIATSLEALWSGEPIAGLTDTLIKLSKPQRNIALKRLEDAHLVSVIRAESTGEMLALDAHPLIREYFAKQLKTQKPDAWQAAHHRLYQHLCDTTKEGEQPTLEDLQPLYHAVAHGCLAGLQKEVDEEVYYRRITQGEEKYAMRRLGAFGSELGALACFFDEPWSRVSSAFSDGIQGWYLNQAAFRLRAVGRLTEALEPMRRGLELAVQREDWQNASAGASNLSELELSLGNLPGALTNAESSVTFADDGGDGFQRVARRTVNADILHQSGRYDEAEALFLQAEELQADLYPEYELLYSLAGIRYCDFLLAAVERAAWQAILTSRSSEAEWQKEIEACQAVSRRASHSLKIAKKKNIGLLNVALDHLTVSRTALYEALLSARSVSISEVDEAVSALRHAGQQQELPRGLLTRALCRSLQHNWTGPDSAQSDLDEAWEISSRGPMPLFKAEVHLHRARLFGVALRDGKLDEYPWESVEHDLSEAHQLIETQGYGRRTGELEDARAALL